MKTLRKRLNMSVRYSHIRIAIDRFGRRNFAPAGNKGDLKDIFISFQRGSARKDP